MSCALECTGKMALFADDSGEAAPLGSLLLPITHGRYRPQIPFRQRVSASLNGRQVKEFLLNIRGQVQQVHDLRHTRLSHLGKPGQLRLVGDDAIPEKLVTGRVITGH